jgi:hypothetical protein
VNRRKNGRASEAVAASAPTKTCSNVPIARRDVRRYHHQAGLRTHECIWSMLANRLPASSQWQSDSLYTRLPLRGQRRVWFLRNTHRLPVSLAAVLVPYQEGSKAPDNFGDDANRRKSD